MGASAWRWEPRVVVAMELCAPPLCTSACRAWPLVQHAGWGPDPLTTCYPRAAFESLTALNPNLDHLNAVLQSMPFTQHSRLKCSFVNPCILLITHHPNAASKTCALRTSTTRMLRPALCLYSLLTTRTLHLNPYIYSPPSHVNFI